MAGAAVLSWLLNDFDLLAVILRACTLTLEALLSGGVLFLLVVARPAEAPPPALRACMRGIRLAALSLAIALLLSLLLAAAILVGNAGLSVEDAISAGPLLVESAAVLSSILVCTLARERVLHSRSQRVLLVVATLGIVAALVGLSHAAAQMQHRAWLLVITALHHLGTAAWIGAMPFLVSTLRRADTLAIARSVLRRYSAMALVGASALLAGGVALAWHFVGTPSGLYGTPYGVMVVVKAILLALMLLLGSANWYAVRTIDRAPQPFLLRLRRLAEVEFGLGITALLVAASLTSQPPAIDITDGRLTWSQVADRLHWQPPRLKSPPLQALAPPTPLAEAVQQVRFGKTADSDANDRAWSEYNHHWAGLVVLLAGLLALASRWRALRWARLWPLSFAGLALFILLRADPENWPLGPRPFWGSFFAPDVLEHRVAALLILVFAVFEMLVQIGSLRQAWARYAFPAMCTLGGALLLTHGHSSSSGRDELLAEITHSSLALCGAVAGWARWLELRLDRDSRRERCIAGYVWPLALIVAALVLLDYREV